MSSHRYEPPRRQGSGLRQAVVLGVLAVVLIGAALAVTVLQDQGGGPAVTARDSTAPGGEARHDRGRSPTTAPAPTAGARRAEPLVPAEPLAESEPDRLVVPALGLDADVMDLGLAGDGTLEVPPGAFPAGWFTGSPTPGELGPAVVAGHVSWNGTPGVFEDLEALGVGDAVEVVREDGTTAEFVVTRTADYDKDAFPTDEVYGDLDHAGLRLITCGGLDADSGVYEDNVVVFADLVGEV